MNSGSDYSDSGSLSDDELTATLLTSSSTSSSTVQKSRPKRPSTKLKDNVESNKARLLDQSSYFAYLATYWCRGGYCEVFPDWHAEQSQS